MPSVIISEKHIERLQQAIRVMESLSPHERKRHFDLSSWGRKTECGTVACVAGHCGLAPWFRRRGLSLKFSKDKGGNSYGDISASVVGFFGTDEPFFSYAYEERGVPQTVKGAIKMLNRAVRHLRRNIGTEVFYWMGD